MHYNLYRSICRYIKCKTKIEAKKNQNENINSLYYPGIIIDRMNSYIIYIVIDDQELYKKISMRLNKLNRLEMHKLARIPDKGSQSSVGIHYRVSQSHIIYLVAFMYVSDIGTKEVWGRYI